MPFGLAPLGKNIECFLRNMSFVFAMRYMKYCKTLIVRGLSRKNIKKDPSKLGRELLFELTFVEKLEHLCWMFGNVFEERNRKSFAEYAGVTKYYSKLLKMNPIVNNLSLKKKKRFFFFVKMKRFFLFFKNLLQNL